ncbi:MAG: hypothetical protein AAF672_16605 [Pseudomonadota bacterium]
MFRSIDVPAYEQRVALLPKPLAVRLAGVYKPLPVDARGRALSQPVNGPEFDIPPAGHRLVLVEGDLRVEGDINMHDLPAKGEDIASVLVVTGNLTCDRLINSWAGAVLVGGDLVVHDVFVNSFENACASVMGRARVHFYHGQDTWLEVQGGAEMRFGDGYALPRGFRDHRAERMLPEADAEASYAAYGFSDGPLWQRSGAFLGALHRGELPFRPEPAASK